jgi:ligand-binding sensor domain-containing protein
VDELIASRQEGVDFFMITHAHSYHHKPPEFTPGMIQMLPEPKGVSLITTDLKGTIWLSNDNEIFQFVDGGFSQYIFNESLKTEEKAVISQSEVVNFGKEAYFYQPDKLPVHAYQALRDLISSQIQSPFAIDKKDRLYVYLEEGLTILDHEKSQIIGRSPGNEKTAAGIHVFDDGRVWLSTAGRIWEYADNSWQQYKLPDKTSTIYQFTQGVDGTIYGASNSEVYQFEGEMFSKTNFLERGENTLVVTSNPDLEDCTFHGRDVLLSDCYLDYANTQDLRYRSLYVGTRKDGSIVYINNHLVARLANGKWQSFLFDNVEINSATMDHDGNIWVYTDQVVMRLDPDVFDDYHAVPAEIAP